MATYPQNIALDAVAAMRLMQKPEIVARRMQELVFETVAATDLPGVLPLESRTQPRR